MKSKIIFFVFCLLVFSQSFSFAVTLTVTNCADSGAGSLRQALTDVTTGDAIEFNIPWDTTASTGEYSAGVVTNEAGSNKWFRIIVNSELPMISKNNIYIKGFSQPTSEGNNNALGPEVEIRGTAGEIDGLMLSGASNCTIEGLVIVNFSGIHIAQSGIQIFDGNRNVIKSCYVGVTASGEGICGNYYGITIQGNSTFNIIGGINQSERNIISGNSSGLLISSNSNEVFGNYIGTSASGYFSVANYIGINLNDGDSNIIGNGMENGRSIISGNRTGIFMADVVGNEVSGNYIGVNPDGITNLTNSQCGILLPSYVNNARNNIIGPRNLIACNGSGESLGGIYIDNVSHINNKITQNSIYSNYNKGITLKNSANQNIPTPEITSVTYAGTSEMLNITGTGTSNAVVEIFKASGNQGRYYLGSVESNSLGSFETTLDISSSGVIFITGETVTVTQTDASNNTSEFSSTREVTITSIAATPTSEPTPEPEPEPTPTTETTSHATQEFSDSSLGVAVTIPANAVSSSLEVTIVEITQPVNPPTGFKIGGKMISLTSSPTSEFLNPVTVTISIESGTNNPKVYYWDATTSSWSTRGITIVSYSTNSVTFTTTHFTTFVPMGITTENSFRFGPNPYNPNNGSARIWYWLSSSADTTIYIMNMNGVLVWKNTYLSGTNGGQAGENNVEFNGKNSWGDTLGNGAYLFKVVQGGRVVGGGKIAVIR